MATAAHWLQGETGDALHALCCAVGYNLRWLMRAALRLGLTGHSLSVIVPSKIWSLFHIHAGISWLHHLGKHEYSASQACGQHLLVQDLQAVYAELPHGIVAGHTARSI